VFSVAQRLQYFIDRVKRGTVCRWWEVNFNKPKYAVILNVTWPPPQRDAIFAFTTTKGEFYATKRFEAEIIRIPPGKYPFFRDPGETILKLHVVHRRDHAAVFAHRDFSIEGDLLEDDIRDINSVLRHSDQIEREVLDLILP
jgi:hypothetical protein